MKCVFCNVETEEKVYQSNLIVIAHLWCAEDRMKDIEKYDIVDCLLYEDRLRYG